jgi:peroxiredoxin Q/BCP
MRLTEWPRIVAASIAASAEGIMNVALGRGERSPVQLKVGDAAPPFVLLGSDGCVYRLQDMKGRHALVISWFPKAFTLGCTKQCESLAGSGAALRQLDVKCFGASIDEPETNKQFATALQIDYPVLSDPDKSVARAYGVIGASGLPSRWTFFIGKDGRILEIDKRVHVGTHGRDIADRLNLIRNRKQAV